MVLLCTVSAIAPAYAALSTVFQYTSAPGDYIGAGASARYTPANSTISISGTAANLTVTIRPSSPALTLWHVDLAAPRGELLRPGRYYDAERAAFRTGRAPGIDVGGDGRGCNKIWGSFSIMQIATDGAGNVTMLDAAFTQRCEGPSSPPLKGIVKFKAPPLSYAFRSEAGDYVGGGAAKVYYGDTSIFTLSGNAASLQYTVSGQRDNWTALISAPAGQQLQPGTYNTARFADSTHARLDIFGNGRGCNGTTGTLRIISIAKDTGGNVIGLYATFEQHCEGATPALRGTIRYYR